MDLLKSFAASRMRDRTSADDVAQETLLRAWQKYDEFVPGSDFKAWVIQIADFISSNLNRLRSARDVSLHAPGAGTFCECYAKQGPSYPWEPTDLWCVLLDANDGSGSDRDDALRNTYNDSVDDELKHALDALRDELRAPFLLVALGGFSYEECSSTLGIPLGTVMSRLWRARDELRRRLSFYARNRGWSGADVI